VRKSCSPSGTTARAGVDTRRLAEAESSGRMGVSRSIRGRVADLGGTLTLDSGPGRGTEWEVRLARLGPRVLR
jgi:signal transduction histidine kinase